MKNPLITRSILCLSLPLVFSSCHPHDEDEAEPMGITCPTPAEVYGYRGVPGDTATACVFGMINTSTGASTSMASFTDRMHFNQGAYNIAENNYYAFKRMDTSRTLLKVSPGGTVTSLSNTSFGSHFDGLVYNRFNNKLYCFNGNKICEIVVSGSSYTTTDVATTINPEGHDNATVDATTGDIYYQTWTAGTTTYNVEKCHPGGSPSTICSGMTEDLWGMRYNPNDHMLYAIRLAASTGYEFVKINSSGTITVLASIPYINAKFCSACIDPCSEHYILAYKSMNTTTGHLYQMSLTGALLHHDSASTMYQGMVVRY